MPRLARVMGLAGLTATGVCSMVGAGINVIPFMIQRNVPGIGPLVTGRRVAAIHRRGKWIVLDLDDAAHLLVHLGMTGQFTVEPANAAVNSHTHLIFDLDVDGQLRALANGRMASSPSTG